MKRSTLNKIFQVSTLVVAVSAISTSSLAYSKDMIPAGGYIIILVAAFSLLWGLYYVNKSIIQKN